MDITTNTTQASDFKVFMNGKELKPTLHQIILYGQTHNIEDLFTNSS
jgi:hypothetical protein